MPRHDKQSHSHQAEQTIRVKRSIVMVRCLLSNEALDEIHAFGLNTNTTNDSNLFQHCHPLHRQCSWRCCGREIVLKWWVNSSVSKSMIYNVHEGDSTTLKKPHLLSGYKSCRLLIKPTNLIPGIAIKTINEVTRFLILLLIQCESSIRNFDEIKFPDKNESFKNRFQRTNGSEWSRS